MFLPAATKLGQGNIFTSVCLSTGRSASVHAGMHPPQEQTPPGSGQPPQSRHPLWEQTPPGADTPQKADSSIRSMSGWYASYWNAFLLHLCVILFTGREGGLPNPPGNQTWGVGQTPGCRPPHADPRIPQQAGGTHPTGMHSCLIVNSSATMTQLEFVAYK